MYMEDPFVFAMMWNDLSKEESFKLYMELRTRTTQLEDKLLEGDLKNDELERQLNLADTQLDDLTEEVESSAQEIESLKDKLHESNEEVDELKLELFHVNEQLVEQTKATTLSKRIQHGHHYHHTFLKSSSSLLRASYPRDRLNGCYGCIGRRRLSCRMLDTRLKIASRAGPLRNGPSSTSLNSQLFWLPHYAEIKA